MTSLMPIFFTQNYGQHLKPCGAINEGNKLGSIETEFRRVGCRRLAKLAHKAKVFANTRGFTSNAVRLQNHTGIESD